MEWVLAGVLSLAGMILGPGIIPLIGSSVIPLVNGHYYNRIFSIFIIGYYAAVIFVYESMRQNFISAEFLY